LHVIAMLFWPFSSLALGLFYGSFETFEGFWKGSRDLKESRV